MRRFNPQLRFLGVFLKEAADSAKAHGGSAGRGAAKIRGGSVGGSAGRSAAEARGGKVGGEAGRGRSKFSNGADEMRPGAPASNRPIKVASAGVVNPDFDPHVDSIGYSAGFTIHARRDKKRLSKRSRCGGNRPVSFGGDYCNCCGRFVEVVHVNNSTIVSKALQVHEKLMVGGKRDFEVIAAGDFHGDSLILCSSRRHSVSKNETPPFSLSNKLDYRLL